MIRHARKSVSKSILIVRSSVPVTQIVHKDVPVLDGNVRVKFVARIIWSTKNANQLPTSIRP